VSSSNVLQIEHLMAKNLDYKPKRSFLPGHRPGGRYLAGLPGSAVTDCVRDCPRSPSDLNGTGLTKHPVLGGLDRAILPDRP